MRRIGRRLVGTGIVLALLAAFVAAMPMQQWRTLYDVCYRCGIAKDPNRVVVVTAGVGSGSSPIRLGAAPDWWLLEVGPGSKSPVR